MDSLLSLLCLICSFCIVTAHSDASARRIEAGYLVETVLDGNSLGISPSAIIPDTNGDFVFVLDSKRSNIYKFSLPLTQNSTKELIAGSPQGEAGYINAKSRKARFAHPKSLTIDGENILYVADRLNYAIRKITNSVVTTIAGSNTSKIGHVDGPGKDARFSGDFRVHYIPRMCSLLLADIGNRMVRQIQLSAENCPPTGKLAVNLASKFDGEYSVDTLFDGNKLRITPYFIHADSAEDYIFVLDNQRSNILKFGIPLSQNSTMQLFAGSSDGETGYVDAEFKLALFSHPGSLTMDKKGNIYVADNGNGAVRKISSSDRQVTTIAGGMTGGKTGYVDGPGLDARFSRQFSVEYVSSLCSLLIVDTGNQVIRQIKLKSGDCSPRSATSSGQHWAWVVLGISLLFGLLLSRKHIARLFHNIWTANRGGPTSAENLVTYPNANADSEEDALLCREKRSC